HLGTDLPEPVPHDAETLVTVGNLVARKRHGDVLRALWLLRDSHPQLRWIVAGDGPERLPWRASPPSWAWTAAWSCAAPSPPARRSRWPAAPACSCCPAWTR